MATKSLPTFKHTSIGAKTHKARTATAHLSYIMRSDAMTKFQAENMPDGGRGTRVYFDRQWEKAGMPESARIADKLMLALPLELNQEQRYTLVQSFMHELGHGRIAWCAAHHDAGEDAHNPHAHVVFKDADIDTGRKVIGTTTNSRDVREAKENGWRVPPRTTTAEMRNSWCDHINGFMERAGLDVRYDPRSLKKQGIDRVPQIHIGPKADALNQKGYDFESQDYHRGQKAIPYSMIDQESRAQYNARIIETNKQNDQARAAGKPEANRNSSRHYPTRAGDQERRELREAQDRARLAMYHDQRRDRDALRGAQLSTKRDHEQWTKKHYAEARERAFQKVREQYADKWKSVRGLDGGKERLQAAAALKLEQQKSYQSESALQVNRCRPDKDKAWKVMHAQNEKERLTLRTTHRQETAALARQHAAERLAVDERWRALSLAQQANRIDARLTGHQGMAAQQKAAVATMKFHRRAGLTNGAVSAPANPHEATKHHVSTAREEQQKHILIRSGLTQQREQNSLRAAASPLRDNAGSRSRKQVAGRPAAEDPQANIRQAIQSGRPLTPAERANASPDVKAQLERKDRMEAVRWVLSHDASGQQQDRGKGRPGGGRGR